MTDAFQFSHCNWAKRRFRFSRFAFALVATPASQSATSIANRHSGARRASTAMSSCVVSSSTSCRRTFTKYDTPTDGIRDGTIMQPARYRCWRSMRTMIPRAEPRRRRDRSSGALSLCAKARLHALQGRPPQTCPQALPKVGAWTMSDPADCKHCICTRPTRHGLLWPTSCSPPAKPSGMRRSPSSLMPNLPCPGHLAIARQTACHLLDTISPIAGSENL